MLGPHPTSVLLIAALSCLPCLTTAQNNTFNSTAYEGCPLRPSYYNTDGSVNATGQVGFRFEPFQNRNPDEDYYLSVTFNETRRASTEYVTYLQEVESEFTTWLSVPKYSGGQACVYMFPGLNASASGSGNNTCEGVLSSKCIDTLMNATSSLVPDMATNNPLCPRLEVDTDLMKEHCGNGTVGTFFPPGRQLAATSEKRHFSNDTCSTKSPPGVSIPDDYRTYPLMGVTQGRPGSEDKINTFDWYDVSVRQSIPFIIAGARLDDRRINIKDQQYYRKQLVCVAPSNITEGSRVPELQFKPQSDDEGGDGKEGNGGDQSAASRTSLGTAGQLAVYAAAAVGLVFVVY